MEPYGVDALTGDARGNDKFSEDAGCILPPFALTTPVCGLVGRLLFWHLPARAPPAGYIGNFAVPHAVTGSPLGKIGSASCRERVKISGVAASLKKKIRRKSQPVGQCRNLTASQVLPQFTFST